jgi:hypothetical protein
MKEAFVQNQKILWGHEGHGKNVLHVLQAGVQKQGRVQTQKGDGKESGRKLEPDRYLKNGLWQSATLLIRALWLRSGRCGTSDGDDTQTPEGE